MRRKSTPRMGEGHIYLQEGPLEGAGYLDFYLQAGLVAVGAWCCPLTCIGTSPGAFLCPGGVAAPWGVLAACLPPSSCGHEFL